MKRQQLYEDDGLVKKIKIVENLVKGGNASLKTKRDFIEETKSKLHEKHENNELRVNSNL